jgi:hypothetical protein
MEALIVLAFCMTGLSMPMRTYIPVFVKDIFPAEGSGNTPDLAEAERLKASDAPKVAPAPDADPAGMRGRTTPCFLVPSCRIIALG